MLLQFIVINWIHQREGKQNSSEFLFIYLFVFQWEEIKLSDPRHREAITLGNCGQQCSELCGAFSLPLLYLVHFISQALLVYVFFNVISPHKFNRERLFSLASDNNWDI